MSTWILIIVLQSSVDYSTAIGMHEFYNKQNCMDARAEILKDIKRGNIYCVQK